jgi:hypothetical protein
MYLLTERPDSSQNRPDAALGGPSDLGETALTLEGQTLEILDPQAIGGILG